MGVLLRKVLNDALRFLLGAHEDAHLAVGHSPFVCQQLDLGGHILHRIFFGSLFARHGHAHKARFGLGLHLLAHVGVNVLQLVGLCQPVFPVGLVHPFAGKVKEVVVEVHHLPLAAVVRVERFGVDVDAGPGHFGPHVPQNAPVTAAPAVDALFHVAHQHAAVTLGHVVEYESLEVAPL